MSGEELVKWLFSYFDFPKLTDEGALRRAVARGTAAVLGYVPAAHLEDGSVVPQQRELIRFGAASDQEEIDFGPGCFVLSPQLARALRGETTAREGEEEPATTAEEEDEGETGAESEPGNGRHRVYRFSVDATAEQLFRILPAVQNLADKADRFVARLEVQAQSDEGLDPSWLRNAVQEHIEEAGLDPGSLER